MGEHIGWWQISGVVLGLYFVWCGEIELNRRYGRATADPVATVLGVCIFGTLGLILGPLIALMFLIGDVPMFPWRAEKEEG